MPAVRPTYAKRKISGARACWDKWQLTSMWLSLMSNCCPLCVNNQLRHSNHITQPAIWETADDISIYPTSFTQKLSMLVVREKFLTFTCLQCCSLHPGDLFPFTRKPLFVIVDSSNSTAYKVRKHVELPIKALLSVSLDHVRDVRIPFFYSWYQFRYPNLGGSRYRVLIQYQPKKIKFLWNVRYNHNLLKWKYLNEHYKTVVPQQPQH